MKIRNTIKQLHRIRPLPELCTGDIQNALRTAIRSLKAWDGEKFLDRPPLERRITYILENFPEALKEGYVVLGLRC